MTTESVTQTQREMAEDLDRYLSNLIKAGGKKVQTGVTEEGYAIVETIALSAAELQAIRARLKDLGVSSTSTPGSAAGDLRANAMLHFKGRPIPALDIESDDAATGT